MASPERPAARGPVGFPRPAMDVGAADAGSGRPHLHDLLAAVVRAVRPPVGDRRFWIIQGMVLLIASAHFLIDVKDLLRSTPFPNSTTVGFLLLPVGYAAVSFGIRGSVATAVWVTLVWLPDLLLPNDRGQPWADVVQLALVIGMAVFVGIHIERERAARVRAELAEAAHAHAERRARSYAVRLLGAQEEERRRIAHELHDAPVQLLAHLVHRLGGRGGAGGARGRTVPAAPTARDLALGALDELRQITRGLRPPLLDELGLMAALRALVAQTSRTSGTEVRLDAPATGPDLSPEVELALFRITQEALTNAVRHGDPGSIAVGFGVQDGRVVLTVADDGQGFDPRAVDGDGRAGLGLLGMRERTELLGGHFEVTSSVGRGTVVLVRVPLAAAAVTVAPGPHDS